MKVLEELQINDCQTDICLVGAGGVKEFNSSVVGCFRKFGVVGCVPYGTQGFLSSLVESSGLFSNKMDRVPSDVSLDTKMEVRYVQYD